MAAPPIFPADAKAIVIFETGIGCYETENVLPSADVRLWVASRRARVRVQVTRQFLEWPSRNEPQTVAHCLDV
jgi:hypothetical protein